jgi:prophage regulatory protein
MQHEAEHNPTSLPTVMRIPEVLRVVGLSRASIYRQMESGEFPRQFKIGTSAVGWLRTEVNQWVSARAAARTSASMPDRHAAAA